jgi:hypothetical protein
VSVKVVSFTVGRDGGWSCVTPSGLVTAERGVQVTILVSETWDEAARAVVHLQTKEPDADPR